MKTNRYVFMLDGDGYIVGYQAVVSGDYDYEGQMSLYPDACEGWFKFIDGKFVLDEKKKAEIIAEREKEAEKPTWEEQTEAQVVYTAMMTDTLLEE